MVEHLGAFEPRGGGLGMGEEECKRMGVYC